MTARAGEKKHGTVFPPCVQLQVLLNWPSCDDRRSTARRRLFQKKSTEQWRKEHPICTLLMIEQTLISLPFTRGQPKLTKLWTKTCNRCPHGQRVTFQAGHAESTIPLNSEN